MGEASLRLLADLVQVLTFLGELLLSLFSSLLHPRSRPVG